MTSEALVLIDMQKAFLDPDGSMARMGADVDGLRSAIPGCIALVEAARAASVPIVHVRTLLRPDYLDGGLIFNEISGDVHSAGLLVDGTEDVEFIDEMTPVEGDFVVEKLRFSAFYATQLEAILASIGATKLTIAGVTTNVCVESTARDAAQRNFDTTVISDATAEVQEDRHVHALETLAAVFCRVAPTAAVVARWSDANRTLTTKDAA